MNGGICPIGEHTNLCTFAGIIGRAERRMVGYVDEKI
jgi:hypothetical protein